MERADEAMPMLRVVPADLKAQLFERDGKQFAVLGFTRPRGWAADLTGAEYEVAVFVLAGRSNAEIARTRQVSPRTVANQVASLFRKLGVSSRGELVAHFASI